MIEIVRLGTHVVTDNPAWPEIRKTALGGHRMRYDFVRFDTGIRIVVVSATVDAEDEISPCEVSLSGAEGDLSLLDSVLAHLRMALTESGHAGPIHLSPALSSAVLEGVAP